MRRFVKLKALFLILLLSVLAGIVVAVVQTRGSDDAEPGDG